MTSTEIIMVQGLSTDMLAGEVKLTDEAVGWITELSQYNEDRHELTPDDRVRLWEIHNKAYEMGPRPRRSQR